MTVRLWVKDALYRSASTVCMRLSSFTSCRRWGFVTASYGVRWPGGIEEFDCVRGAGCQSRSWVDWLARIWDPSLGYSLRPTATFVYKHVCYSTTPRGRSTLRPLPQSPTTPSGAPVCTYNRFNVRLVTGMQARWVAGWQLYYWHDWTSSSTSEITRTVTCDTWRLRWPLPRHYL